MEVVWLLKNEEKRVILTENSFRNSIDSVLGAKDDDFIRINDSRFDGGTALYLKKSEILGWRCPESAMQKYLSRQKEVFDEES